MSSGSKGSWLWYVGVATIGLTIWTMLQTDDEPVVTKSDRKSSRKSAQGQVAEHAGAKNNTEIVENLRLDFLVREDSSAQKANPFASPVIPKPVVKKVAPPPPPPPPEPPPPPPPPTAPPMPYSFFGSYEEGSKRTILLVKDSKIFTATEGVNLDNAYRVVKVEAKKVDVIYLPLGITQSIDIGESSLTSKK